MSIPSLDALAEDLEARGDDAQRLELVERARRFKRAWVEMAEGLTLVQRTRAYARWGYRDVFEYADKELHIRRPTVEKLTNSYMAVRKYAPSALAPDREDQAVPPLEAVDYFLKASAREDALPASRRDDVLGELKAAIFEEARPLAAVRKEFGPVFFEKKAAEREQELLEKTRGAAKRLLGLLRNVGSVPPREREAATESLEALVRRLDKLLPEEVNEGSARVAASA